MPPSLLDSQLAALEIPSCPPPAASPSLSHPPAWSSTLTSLLLQPGKVAAVTSWEGREEDRNIGDEEGEGEEEGESIQVVEEEEQDRLLVHIKRQAERQQEEGDPAGNFNRADKGEGLAKRYREGEGHAKRYREGEIIQALVLEHEASGGPS